MSMTLSLQESRSSRDRVLEATAGANQRWMDRALVSLVRTLINGRVPVTFTGEWIRQEVASRAGAPTHPNCWGALVNTALRAGYIEATERWTPMLSKRSHGRRTPLYRSLIGGPR